MLITDLFTCILSFLSLLNCKLNYIGPICNKNIEPATNNVQCTHFKETEGRNITGEKERIMDFIPLQTKFK